MTRKYSLLLILIIGLLQLGCTRNNGDIGDLFGTWRLDTLTEDGKELDLYGGMTKVYTWAFQSHIIRVQDIRNNMDHSNCYDPYYSLYPAPGLYDSGMPTCRLLSYLRRDPILSRLRSRCQVAMCQRDRLCRHYCECNPIEAAR